MSETYSTCAQAHSGAQGGSELETSEFDGQFTCLQQAVCTRQLTEKDAHDGIMTGILEQMLHSWFCDYFGFLMPVELGHVS